jgi:DNA polymerase III subunit beta
MKLTLTQPDLNQALRSVSRAVGTGRNSHPVLAHVLLTTGNGNLQISAYDLDLGITTPGGSRSRYRWRHHHSLPPTR